MVGISILVPFIKWFPKQPRGYFYAPYIPICIRLPKIRRAFPKLILNSDLNVQPMAQPIMPEYKPRPGDIIPIGGKI
jgi:hypothetical protein